MGLATSIMFAVTEMIQLYGFVHVFIHSLRQGGYVFCPCLFACLLVGFLSAGLHENYWMGFPCNLDGGCVLVQNKAHEPLLRIRMTEWILETKVGVLFVEDIDSR